ncbi:MAG: excinuclease ABC subunit UvrA, partial [Planctomycetota bacterium]|nr:excinuclease ABC subunit UvrA [Planctomycetota bacterium]
MARSTETVVIKGAKEHNLRGVDLEFPRDALTTFTGVSGSGKSSLAYQTIYKEGQRRFLESLSSYARQFLGRMEKPKVDHIDGLSPTVSIDQKAAGHSPRSTVGTLTEVLDFLRLFMARLGTPACPTCGAVVESWSLDRIVEAIADRYCEQAVMVLAPVVRERKGEYRQELRDFRQRGFVRARIDGELRRLDEPIELHRYKYHSIELVVDRLRLDGAKRSRLAEAVEQALDLSDGLVAVLHEDHAEYFSTRRACPEGHGSLPELEPRLFSFNSPVGACAACDGLGETHSFSEELLVPDPALSVSDGALACITAEGKLAYSRLTLEHLAQVAKEFGFSLDDPWEKLKKKDRRVLLHGSKTKQFEFRWRKQGARYAAHGLDRQSFTGVIGHLESVYRRATARHLDRFRAAARCPACEGARLKEIACAVTYAGHSLPAILAWTVIEARAFFSGLELHGVEAQIGVEILRALEDRLRFLEEVGLGYLTLDRRARTLSGGESQRIRLAAQVGSGLRGVLYVLDEPSIGLHPRDQSRLLQTLGALRDRGNTVCVVEHDEETMRASDFLVDIGPGAGRDGGHIVAAGSVEEVERSDDSCTGAYLRGDRRIPIPSERRQPGEGGLVIRGACQHNLKKIDVKIPLGLLVAVTGVSGSGKSTLINSILKRVLRREIHGAHEVPGKHRRIEGLDLLDKVIEIDQSPIGRTPRSNPATYTGLWTHVRDLFAAMPESRLRDYRKGRFSFNVQGGRCESCDGAGQKILEMQFLAPVEITCEDCLGSRFNVETLEILFKGYNVHDVLEMTVTEAHELFGALPKIARILRTLLDVGLGYVKLGQPSTTLSGGEAQRMKLASELHRPATGRTIYLLDEPTTGLHFADIETLLAAIHRLVEGGNTVVVIEHNLDVVKNADWVIDLGPEGGDSGGYVVAVGTPEDVAEIAESHTGRALGPVLGPRRRRKSSATRQAKRRSSSPITEIEIRGASKNNLCAIDARLPLDRLTVVTGVSGSGKSSLAFDTLFSEGQRRFVESMSTYARRFLGRMDRAPVERLDGLGPAIAIEQRASHRSPRSTVATTTEIHDHLRLLYARVGRSHCPEHGQELVLHAPGSIARTVLREFEGRRGYLLVPVTVPAGLFRRKRELKAFLEGLREQWRRAGYVRAMVNGLEQRLESSFEVPSKSADLSLSLIIDRLTFDDRRRLVDGIEQAEVQGDGRVIVRDTKGQELLFSLDRSCPHCGFAVPEQPHPRYFSFNHHSGACDQCSGIGAVVSCDPELLVNHPERPLFRGAIRHKGSAFTFLTRRSGWYHKVAT